MLRRWAEGDFKGDPQLALIPSLYNQLIKEGIDFSSTSGSSDVSTPPNITSSINSKEY